MIFVVVFSFLLFMFFYFFFFFFQAEDGIRDKLVTGVQTCALPISPSSESFGSPDSASSVGSSASPDASSETGSPTAAVAGASVSTIRATAATRSEEHTSELQSLAYLVCRLLLEKKKDHQADPRESR